VSRYRFIVEEKAHHSVVLLCRVLGVARARSTCGSTSSSVRQRPTSSGVSDISYIRTCEGWLYLAVILDAFSRKVVGWALADHLRTELATAALHMALTSRRPRPRLIHHSDRGVQYVSTTYRQMLAEHGLRLSIGRPGTCWDNAVPESFFATLKKELIYPHIWPTRQLVRTAIFAFIEGWYNGHRLHSRLDYTSPNIYEEDYHRLTAAA
jgi:putative transposase